MFMKSPFKHPARTGVSRGLPQICFTFILMAFIQDAARSVLKFKLQGINMFGPKFLYHIYMRYSCCPVSSLFSLVITLHLAAHSELQAILCNFYDRYCSASNSFL
jgi:hypothetical protein